MHTLSDSSRPIGESEISGEAGAFAVSFTGQSKYKGLITSANTVPIQLIFKHYGLRIDENNAITRCPLKSHKGGRENTPSFKYYPSTNTFWCFGCKTGRACCDFVAVMDGTNRITAANKILDLFHNNIEEENIYDIQDFSEKLEIMLKFSNSIRTFRENNCSNLKALEFIDEICHIYDNFSLKKGMDNNSSLKSIVDQLIVAIEGFRL